MGVIIAAGATFCGTLSADALDLVEYLLDSDILSKSYPIIIDCSSFYDSWSL